MTYGESILRALLGDDEYERIQAEPVPEPEPEPHTHTPHVWDGMYVPVVKAGRAANGAELDRGRVVHAVRSDHGGWGPALCGSAPQGRSAGWSDLGGDVDLTVTCPRCAAHLRRIDDIVGR